MHSPYRKKWLVMQHRSGLFKLFKNGTRWWAFLFHGWYFLVKGVVGLGLLLIVAEFAVSVVAEVLVTASEKMGPEGWVIDLVAVGLWIAWYYWMYRLAKKAPTLLLPREVMQGWRVVAEFNTKKEALDFIYAFRDAKWE